METMEVEDLTEHQDEASEVNLSKNSSCQSNDLSQNESKIAPKTVQVLPDDKSSLFVKQDSEDISALYLAAVLLFMCVNCYFNSLQGEFVYDDNKVVLNNLDLRPTTSLLDLFKNDFWGTPLYSDRSHKSYRPLCILTFRWNFAIGGFDPTGYHFVNIMCHWVVCVLIMHIFKRFMSQWLSFCMAMLFMVHPIHTEAVAGVVGRAEILSSILALLAFQCYCNATGYRKNTNWQYMGFTVVLVVMSTLCKEQGITIIAVCCAYEVLWLHRVTLWSGFELLAEIVRNPQTIPLWIVNSVLRMLTLVSSAAVLVILRIFIMGAKLPNFVTYDNPAAFAETPIRQLTMAYILPLNVWLMLYPHDLLCDYGSDTVPLVKSITDPRNLATFNFFISLGVLTNFALTANSKLSRQVSMGLAFLVFPFLPASNLFFPVGFVIAERILFVPSIGFSMLVVIGLQQLIKQKRLKHLVYFFLMVTLMLHAGRTARRNLDWKSKDSLYRSGLHITTMNPKLWLNYGHQFENRNEFHEALLCYNESFQSNFAAEAGVWTELGLLYLTKGEDVNAEAAFLEAQNVMAPSITSNRYSHKYVNTFYSLGVIKLKNESTHQEAENFLKKAIKLDHQYMDAYHKLSELYINNKTPDKAVPVLNTYLEINPRSDKTLFNLGLIYRSVKEYSKARELFRESLKYNPSNNQARLQLAMLLEQTEDEHRVSTEELIQHFTLVLKADPGNANLETKLGELYMQSGETDKAITILEHVLEIDENHRNALEILAYIYSNNGYLDAAYKLYKRYTVIYNEDTQGWFRLGLFYSENVKDYKKAQNCFNEVLKLNPGEMNAAYNICVLYTKLSEWVLAEECLAELVEQHPTDKHAATLLKVRKHMAEL